MTIRIPTLIDACAAQGLQRGAPRGKPPAEAHEWQTPLQHHALQQAKSEPSPPPAQTARTYVSHPAAEADKPNRASTSAPLMNASVAKAIPGSSAPAGAHPPQPERRSVEVPERDIIPIACAAVGTLPCSGSRDQAASE